MLHTWRFDFGATPLPLLTYDLNRGNRADLESMFACPRQPSIGEFYVVSHRNRSATLFSRHSKYVSSSPNPTLPFVSDHYSAPYNLYKLDMLRHIPARLQEIVLIDRDVIMSPRFLPCVEILLSRQKTPSLAMMSVSSAGGAFQGLQSGVIAFRLPLLRKLGVEWWDVQGMPRRLPLAEQTLWDYFSKAKPDWIDHFPCGFHLETQVLQAALIDRGLSSRDRYPSAARCANDSARPRILHGAGGMRHALPALAAVLPEFQCRVPLQAGGSARGEKK